MTPVQILQMLGSVAEIAGVVLMANGYLSPARGETAKLQVLMSALFGGPSADGAEEAYDAGLSSESYRSVLRGLAVVGLGFLLQAVALLVSIASNGT